MIAADEDECYNGYGMEVEEFRKRLEGEYGQFRWVAGRKFKFRPPRTIVYEKFVGTEGVFGELNGLKVQYCLSLLHELGHALLGHRSFETDFERLKMEREAWEKAAELAEKYEIEFDMDYVEVELDSYRDWLHVRSRCRECGLTRYQTQDGRYHCPNCENFRR